MNKQILKEIILTIIILILIAISCNMEMPPKFYISLNGILVLAFGLFSFFV
jgi:hypothetical protein